MSSVVSSLSDLPALNQVVVPDLWQQQAVAALRDGKDVVVQAPTGSGKTLIFELWSNNGKNRGQAIYTVPTRALANDKLAEWRARGWDVGIATGDLAENLSAPVIVATLETQKQRLIQGEGPTLLVVDEYQMIADQDRGLNYELALALAPASTQILLLSGSVANPQDMLKWFQRLGRSAMLVRHDERPVPLEEVHANQLSYHVPSEIKGYWPRLVAKALAEDLGPILIFAPRRQGAEIMASELARQLPNPNPLQLSTEQKLIVGDNLAKLLKSRVTYHHSGLSYGARAGVIEPLAKAGQLRVVVATMGLAAGINFSLRSAALAAESYRRDESEQMLRSDEIMQMFGRAGRRGLDETGFVLVTANEIRLFDAHPIQLSRSAAVDWSTLLGIMTAAADTGKKPFEEAVKAQERLFTTKPIFLGVEESLRHPVVPCDLHTDSERARHVRQRVRQFLNSRGEWENSREPAPVEIGKVWMAVPVKTGSVAEGSSPGPRDVPARSSHDDLKAAKNLEAALENSRALRAGTACGPLQPELGGTPAVVPTMPELVPALSVAQAVEKVGTGSMCVLSIENQRKTYGRSLTVAERINGDRVLLAKWVRRLTDWNSRQVPASVWTEQVEPLVRKKLEAQQTPVMRIESPGARIIAFVSIAALPIRVITDSHGVALWKPVERDVLPPDCAICKLVPVCDALPTTTGTALLWRRLGLVNNIGVPTTRGRIVSFFSQGDGLAIAAALEQSSYALEELCYDLANLDAGFRFCGDENRWSGRLAESCHQAFGLQSVPGYLENGVPPKYGAGASEVVVSVHKNPLNKHGWISDLLGPGDIDRVIIEWRSMLRQIAHAPDLEMERWRGLQKLARTILNETSSPTLIDLPPLEYHQTKRVDHRLLLRRH
jgi:superfamily II DNA/RNA helicase